MKKLLCAFFMICASLVQAEESVICPEGTTQFKEVKDGITSIGCNRVDENGNSIKHGPYKSVYPNGQLAKIATLVDGKVDGLYEEKFENGKTKIKEHQKLGVLHGEFNEYYPNGQLAETGMFVEGKVDGLFETRYENGKTKRKEQQRQGELHGEFTEYHPSGQLSQTGTFVDGKLNGSYEERYENGKIKLKGNYKNGELHGELTKYYPNGVISEKATFLEGKRDGPFEENFENGKIKAKENYKNGELHGDFNEYHPNGKKFLTGKFENDKGIAAWELWDLSGKSIAKGKYDDVIAAQQLFIRNSETGFALTENVFSKCYAEQISSMKTGEQMKGLWFPKEGVTFRADDQLYTIYTVLSRNPIQLLIQGPAQQGFSSELNNSCYIVLTVKNSNFLKSETTGKVATVGDLVHGFQLKSIGKTKVGLQRLRDISKTDLVLPQFELLTTFGLVQGK